MQHFSNLSASSPQIVIVCCLIEIRVCIRGDQNILRTFGAQFPASDNFFKVDSAVTSTGSDWLHTAAITRVAWTDKASLFREIF